MVDIARQAFALHGIEVVNYFYAQAIRRPAASCPL